MIYNPIFLHSALKMCLVFGLGMHHIYLHYSSKEKMFGTPCFSYSLRLPEPTNDEYQGKVLSYGKLSGDILNEPNKKTTTLRRLYFCFFLTDHHHLY